MLDIEAPSEIAARDQALADLYKRVLSVALNEPAVTAVVTWGLSDRCSWNNLWHEPYFRRSNGLHKWPLPFDDAFQQPAFYALRAAFQNAPLRQRS